MKYIIASVVATIMLVAITVIVFELKKEKYNKVRDKILWTACIVLIVFKILEYTYAQIIGNHSKLPIEFSQVSYFLLPIAVFVSKKTKALLPIGVFAGLLAGFFYNLGWIVSPKAYFDRETTYTLIKALLSHNVLYFCAMIVLTTIKLPAKKFWHLLVGVGAIIGWHYFMHSIVDNQKDVILKAVCEGTILDYIYPDFSKNMLYVAIYYVVVATVFSGLIALFYKSNNMLTKKNNIDQCLKA